MFFGDIGEDRSTFAHTVHAFRKHSPLTARGTLWDKRCTMRPETLSAAIHARLPKSHKRQLDLIAQARHLRPADIIREALRLYITERTQPKQEAGR